MTGVPVDLCHQFRYAEGAWSAIAQTIAHLPHFRRDLTECGRELWGKEQSSLT